MKPKSGPGFQSRAVLAPSHEELAVVDHYLHRLASQDTCVGLVDLGPVFEGSLTAVPQQTYPKRNCIDLQNTQQHDLELFVVASSHDFGYFGGPGTEEPLGTEAGADGLPLRDVLRCFSVSNETFRLGWRPTH